MAENQNSIEITINNTSPSTSTSTNTFNNSNTYSYAGKLRNKKPFTPPKRDQAITLDTIPETNLEEYLTALANVINPQKIIFASRISDQRICIYFTDQETVEKLIKEQKTLTIGENQIVIRRLNNPSTKLIISYAWPEIPNETIAQKLIEIGLKLTSPINYLRIGTRNENLININSFRRQVYISKNENLYIPDSLIVEFEERQYKIYLSEDNLRCPICKKLGHTENLCHNKNNSQTPYQQTRKDLNNSTQTPLTSSYEQPRQDIPTREKQINQQTNETKCNQEPIKRNTTNITKNTNETTKQPTINKTKEPNLQSTNEPETNQSHSTQKVENGETNPEQSTSDLIRQLKQKQNEWKLQLEEHAYTKPNPLSQEIITNMQQFINDITTQSTPQKRPALKSTSSEENTSKTENEPKKKSTKKPKSNNIDEKLKKIKAIMENNPNKYPIDYPHFKDILENSTGNKNKHLLVQEYTEDTTQTIKMLDEFHSIIEDSGLKNRLTRLKNKLIATPFNENGDDILEY